jgi:uronate dehydrogenase
MSRDLHTETWAITGAAGRIGTTLRDGLLPLVAGLVLLDTRELSEVRPGERALVADIGDPAALREAFAGVAGVIHLAAIPDEADFRDLVEANIVGTGNVLEAARRAGVARIVYASTGRTMGMNRVGDIVGPERATRPDGFYAVSKVAGEALCRLYVDKFGFTATCLRIGAFEVAPREARDLGVWLSPADAVEAVLAGMRQAGGFEVLIAVSNNRDGWYDLAPGRALGYFPRDDAAEHLDSAPITEGLFSGELGTPEFTLGRQRPF